MSLQALFGLNIAMSFRRVGSCHAAVRLARFARRPRADALRPILVLHSFRFIGLAFLVPGVVSPDLPSSFAVPAAYGDLTTAIRLCSRSRRSPGGWDWPGWAFNILGSVDLLHAFYEGNRTVIGVDPGDRAPPISSDLRVPLLLITHGVAFRLLLQKPVRMSA